MVLIRREQMEAMRDSLKQTYEPELLDFICQQHPEVLTDSTESECREVIQESIKKAGRYGLHDLYDVQQFLQCMLWLGVDFDTEHEWAQAVLDDIELSAGEKADVLEDAALNHLSKQD